MPMVDIELVCETPSDAGAVSTRALADALGEVFRSPPGRTWVRLRVLRATAYAENGVDAAVSGLPVFVTVLHAHPPTGPALADEALAVTAAVAGCLARPPERVHVQYAPPGAGRQAFGGQLVR